MNNQEQKKILNYQKKFVVSLICKKFVKEVRTFSLQVKEIRNLAVLTYFTIWSVNWHNVECSFYLTTTINPINRKIISNAVSHE